MLTRWLQVLMLGGLLSLLTIGTQAEQALPQPLIIGRGSIEWADWHPDGETIMVSTVNGAWLYTKDLQDLAHFPEARLARFSPDGRYIAGVDDKHILRLWDAKTFEPVKSIESSQKHIVHQLTWSPDSRYLVIAGVNAIDETILWDVEADEYGWGGMYMLPADRLTWSPESTYLAGIKTETGSVWVWDAKQKKLVFSDTPEYPPDYGVLLAWKGERQLTRGSFIDTLLETDTWDVVTNTLIDNPSVGSSSQLSYSTNGRYLAIAHINGGAVIDTFHAETVFAANVDQATFGVSVITWSPDEQRIAAGSAFALFSNLASVWIANPFTGEITHTFQDHHRCVNMIRWQPQAEYLLSVGCHDELVVRNLNEPELVYKSLEHTLITTTLAWKDDGSQFAIADALGNVHIRDAHSGDILMTLRHPYVVRKIIWQPGGDLLATRSDDAFYNILNSGIIRIWSTIDGTQLPDFAQDETIYIDMDWSVDGNLLAVVGGGLNSLQVRDVTHPDQSYQIPVMETVAVEAVKWSPDAKTLAVPFSSSGNGGGVFLFAVPSGSLPQLYAPRYASTHVWTPDNSLRWLSWGFYGDVAYIPPIIKLTTGLNDFSNVQHTLTGMSTYTVQGYLSPQGKFAAAVGENKSGLVWDTATGAPLFSLADVKQLFWSPDETMLAVRRYDHQIWIYNAYGLIHSRLSDDVTGAPFIPGWSPMPAKTVVWSADSQRLAHVYGGTVAIWDIDR